MILTRRFGTVAHAPVQLLDYSASRQEKTGLGMRRVAAKKCTHLVNHYMAKLFPWRDTLGYTSTPPSLWGYPPILLIRLMKACLADTEQHTMTSSVNSASNEGVSKGGEG